jgi:hypothetical protein
MAAQRPVRTTGSTSIWRGLTTTHPALAIVVLLVIVAATSLGFALAFPVSRTPSTPTGLQPPFAVGNAVEGVCAAGGSFPTTGCFAGDFEYALTIEESNLRFGTVSFRVETDSGAIYQSTGGQPGFSILNATGVVAAYSIAGASGMLTSAGWTYVGAPTATTSLGTLYSIVVDMGTANPAGMSLTFWVYGTGGTDAFCGLP